MAELNNAHFWEEMRGSWATALLSRPPALVLAWACGRAGLRPLVVTGFAFFVALSLPVLAWTLPLGWAVWAVFAVGWFYQVLDCTDGSLARVSGQTSRVGADLDFLIDMVQWGLLYIALGLLADRVLQTGGFGWTALAGAAAWARLLARVVRDRVTGPDSPPAGPIRPIDWPSVFLGGISGMIPFLALAGPWLGLAIWALLIYAVLDCIEGAWPLWSRE